MPFYWIESILAISFTLVWVFIGMTLLGDRLSEVRQRRSALQSDIQGPHFSAKRNPIKQGLAKQGSGKRVASVRPRRRKSRTTANHMAV